MVLLLLLLMGGMREVLVVQVDMVIMVPLLLLDMAVAVGVN
jgi:hypothetical protein